MQPTTNQYQLWALGKFILGGGGVQAYFRGNPPMGASGCGKRGGGETKTMEIGARKRKRTGKAQNQLHVFAFRGLLGEGQHYMFQSRFALLCPISIWFSKNIPSVTRAPFAPFLGWGLERPHPPFENFHQP